MILYVVDASAASAGDTVAVAVAFYWKDSFHPLAEFASSAICHEWIYNL
jgi:hypothetical protein